MSDHHRPWYSMEAATSTCRRICCILFIAGRSPILTIPSHKNKTIFFSTAPPKKKRTNRERGRRESQMILAVNESPVLQNLPSRVYRPHFRRGWFWLGLSMFIMVYHMSLIISIVSWSLLFWMVKHAYEIYFFLTLSYIIVVEHVDLSSHWQQCAKPSDEPSHLYQKWLEFQQSPEVYGALWRFMVVAYRRFTTLSLTILVWITLVIHQQMRPPIARRRWRNPMGCFMLVEWDYIPNSLIHV